MFNIPRRKQAAAFSTVDSEVKANKKKDNLKLACMNVLDKQKQYRKGKELKSISYRTENKKQTKRVEGETKKQYLEIFLTQKT
ncbi:CLUMA_CG018387, isoform A [Clunio marinus]|uniref:CLUMA_CG018387, isoform A n=1 Tax=Clunio marinus TaxID=568069 RepID=A0A1J1J0C6_9DIPT|nr:CLUMA_CG018387, isoform A [Clunio marinus]